MCWGLENMTSSFISFCCFQETELKGKSYFFCSQNKPIKMTPFSLIHERTTQKPILEYFYMFAISIVCFFPIERQKGTHIKRLSIERTFFSYFLAFRNFLI